MEERMRGEGGIEVMNLDSDIGFPLYASSRAITRLYQPFLEDLDLTYPQYIVLLVLWESGIVSVKEIGDRLLLNTNTLTPLLKRMQETGLVERSRSQMDERVVMVALTTKGQELKERALDIPAQLVSSLEYPVDKILELKKGLDEFLLNLRSLEKLS